MCALNCFKAHVIFCLTCPLSLGAALLQHMCALLILIDLLLVGLGSLLWVVFVLCWCLQLWRLLWCPSDNTPLASRATLALVARSVKAGEPPACSWVIWKNPSPLASLFSFSPRGRGSGGMQPICSATFWPPGLQGYLGQSSKDPLPTLLPNSHIHTGFHRPPLGRLFPAFAPCSDILWSRSSNKGERSPHQFFSCIFHTYSHHKSLSSSLIQDGQIDRRC